jgi:hypothetical protein
MTPFLGVSFLALTGISFGIYIAFLIQQHKVQDELARRWREGEMDRWQKSRDAAVLK